MRRKLYTAPEIVLCTFISKYGRDIIQEQTVCQLQERSESSIKMKVQNIASMLNEEGIDFSNEVSVLTGLPEGKKGRRTNWEIVSKLVALGKEKHKALCFEILNMDNQ